MLPLVIHGKDFLLQRNYIWSYGEIRMEAKKRADIRKRGFDFADVDQMFRGFLIAEPDLRDDYGEPRWSGLGVIRGGVAQVIFAERDLETIRIISLRKAPSREQKEYEKAIADRLEAN
jgi:uncharacterized protein